MDNGFEKNAEGLSNFLAREIQFSPELSLVDVLRVARKRMGAMYDIPFTPDAFVWLIQYWVKTLKPQKVLCPFADGSEIAAFEDYSNVDFRFANKEYETVFKNKYSINLIGDDPVNSCYDLVIADLPLGTVGKGGISSKIIEESINIINQNGYAIFTFARGFNRGNNGKWIKELENKGLYCNAVLDMPPMSYAPLTSIETVVGVFSKKDADKILVASLEDENIVKIIVDNFIHNQSSKATPKAGVFVDKEVCSYQDYSIGERIKKTNIKLAGSYNAELKQISAIGELHSFSSKTGFIDNMNSVYVPKTIGPKVVTDTKDFEIDSKSYIQIVVDTNVMLPRFMAYFLNSEAGRNIRRLHSNGMVFPALSIGTLKEMSIPCPSMSAQVNILEVNDTLDNLQFEIRTMKDKLEKYPAANKSVLREIKDINNKGDRFAQWIELLPYPLATILKRYSVADSIEKKQEFLFYFFEAYSIFEATILSAALDKKRIDITQINDVDVNYFEKASFGNWVRLDIALTRLFSGMLNSKENEERKALLSCFKTDDETLVRLLCNKNVNGILDKTSVYRNSWKGHGGLAGEAVFNEHVSVLDSLLHELQDKVKDLYERIRLIRPIGLKCSEGVFHNHVEVLTGSNPIFKKDDFVSVSPLDDKYLYLQITDTGEFLKLPPFFIMKNSPLEAKNACYFYNRVEGGNTRYVSYHFETRPEDMEEGISAFDSIKSVLSV